MFKKTLQDALPFDFSIETSSCGTAAAAAVSLVTGSPKAAIISKPVSGRACLLLHLTSE